MTDETPKKPSAFVEAVAANDIRADVWRAALIKHKGNITRAARDEFGFSKQRGHELTRLHSLVEEAKRLRAEAGQPATGRPRKPVIEKAPSKGSKASEKRQGNP